MLRAITSRGKQWPKVEHAEIVKRARILVIDDSDFPYMPLFRRDGYTVAKWNTVKDLSQLETGRFDLVLLDLYGVGTTLSPDQGFGILKHIRQVNPAQIVIAYSNADWSLDYQPFFQNADAVLHKTKADYFEFKRTVDQLLERRFSLGFYLERARAELGEHGPNAPKAEKKIRSAIRSGNVDSLTGYLSARVEDAVTVDRVIQVVQVAIGVAQVWKS